MPERLSNVRFRGAGSTRHCNTARSLSAGVSNPKVFRGRWLSRRAILSRLAWEKCERSVPRGKYCRSRPLVLPLLKKAWLSAARKLVDTLKIAVSFILIAPLAFFMGLPFPLALVRVAAARPGLVPWAWGINGCASVLSAILAILLAMSLGFSAILLIAIGLYLVAAATLR